MNPENLKKYTAFPAVELPDRTWPNRRIEKAPTWCSVDLRDGNQALITPMNIEQKLEMFQLLVDIGFKEIEVGFPSASASEFKFLRRLIEGKLIPSDVSIQVLTQAREHLIERTFEALTGANKVIFHMYNSTSVLQRDVVFRKNKSEIKEIAVQGIRWIKEFQKGCDADITLQYSPESFTGTEVDFAVDVCQAVLKEWGGTEKIIINLPATVELSTPNLYADMIESFLRQFKARDKIILSLHTHNDRGTGVAATELGLMAGGERVEGTLFGNGERTGNVDIVTLALNLYTQGVDPMLHLENIDKIIEISNRCTHIPVHARQPYAGNLVYTAFSGSHQDAIKKGMAHQSEKKDPKWEVPYLPIDPTDLGRTYEAIIRITSQSGKGGIAYVMEQEFGCLLPKSMHAEFAQVVQGIADKTGEEVHSDTIWKAFSGEYLERETPIKFLSFQSSLSPQKETRCQIAIEYNNTRHDLPGTGNGPIDACKDAICHLIAPFQLVSYYEHSLDEGSGSKAIAYIQIKSGDWTGFGVGIDTNINIASIKAVISALNRKSQAR